ncbi:uncharacterized protein L201_007922 [Kwoniella dendrophila CBS 6074]|uniref:Uncharacterized protein n=1 Tax=Kwoniella dendrophila CBS 6074 TaxID=1295534 RepID=A0AAX4K757_9TREE
MSSDSGKSFTTENGTVITLIPNAGESDNEAESWHIGEIIWIEEDGETIEIGINRHANAGNETTTYSCKRTHRHSRGYNESSIDGRTFQDYRAGDEEDRIIASGIEKIQDILS